MSDIDTAVVVDGLKALDPKWPIREADIGSGVRPNRFMGTRPRFRIGSMHRSVLYTALALYVFGTPATAEERFEQWSLEPQGEGTFALAFKRPIPTQNGVGTGLAFICNQESNYVVGILAPSPGTFKNRAGVHSSCDLKV